MQENELLSVVREGMLAVAANVRADLGSEIDDLRYRLERLEDEHCGPMLLGSALTIGILMKIEHEAEQGDWRPWVWAEELGIPQHVLLAALVRHHSYMERAQEG